MGRGALWVVCGGAAVLAGVRGITIPEGPAVTDIYPPVDYWYGGDFRPNPLCEDPKMEGAPVTTPPKPSFQAEGYPFRRSVGLKELSKSLLDVYNSTFAGRSASDVRYLAAARRKRLDWNSVMNNTVAASLGDMYNNSPNAGFANEVCSSFRGSARDDLFCYAVGNFTQTVQCLSNYQYANPDAVKATLAPSAKLGFTLDDACTKGLTPGKAPLQLPLQLFDLLPPVLDRSTAQSEYKTYFLAWKALDHLERYAEYRLADEIPKLGQKRSLEDLLTDKEIPREILPGWNVERVFYLNQFLAANAPSVRLPYAVVAKNGRDLLVVIRRPITTYEARLGSFNGQTYHELYGFTGALHDGAGTIRNAMSGTFRDLIKAHMKFLKATPNQGVKLDSVTFVGALHPSTGVALGLVHDTIKMRKNILGDSDPRLSIQSITFGSPYMADKELADLINKNVNVRHLQMEGEAYDTFPCAQNRGCDERNLAARTWHVTGEPAVFEPTKGAYMLDFDELKLADPKWNSPAAILQLAAIHDCALPCILSTYACPNDQAAKLCKTCPSFI